MRTLLFLNCSKKAGGAELSLLEILKRIDKNKFSIHLGLSKQNDLHSLIPNQVIRSAFSIKHIGKKEIFSLITWINIIYTSIEILKYVSNKKIDIIYCNTSKAIYFCIMAKLFTSAKVLCHCRDNEKNVLARFLIKTLSNKIICNSSFIKKQMKASDEKSQVCYNGIDFSKFSPKYDVESCSTSLKVDDFVIANIGQAVQWKRQELFINIAASVIQKQPSVHFLLVIYNTTDNDERYIENIKDKIKRLGLEQHFSVTGFNYNIVSILAKVNLLIHTATREPFGRIVAEALSMQIPVIASAEGGMKEIITDNVNGYLIRDMEMKIDFISEKVAYLINHPSKYKKLGQQGREAILKKFDPEQQIKELEQIISIQLS